ncbi:receptor-type tyrosine-protein phosphatase beta isoform X3 [Pleuronectes platessa]|uniref:receptor-type tyrosine-protein phosphatase beta isoform X3 n=1 Tax=Pleuronectes platessa TaxID=8262 RepID=UPI00232A429C|nr:receptor-type tyrosine-protein phosphatase beta isoform X3 [Pleuronectes platessa]
MMQPLRRSGVSLWTLLLLCALPENSSTGCDEPACVDNGIGTFTISTTTVSLVSRPNCTLSTVDNIHGNGSLTGLTSGVVYPILINCSNCCKNITTKPEVIRNLTVMNVTTSTVSLSWIEPVGNSSLYRVHWTDGRLSGTLNVTETYVHITNLTAGVKNEISVTAVADDGHTGGQSFTVVRYTKPEVIRNLTAMNVTTSTVSLTWIEPVGNSSLYRVHWTDGRLSGTLNVTETYVHITNLTAGVKNEISVTAVADDGHTGGQSFTFVRYTKPEVIRNLTVMNVTTSTVSLTWIEPVGNSSLYRVHWTDGRLSGTLNVTETYVHITNLTAGVKNEISVTAVADDGHTGGQSFTVVRYTKSEVIRNLTVMNVTTSTVSLTWIEPVGNSSLYRVHWTDGRLSGTLNVTETYVHITNLTAGVKNEISVTAVADDSHTGGQSFTVVRYTKPEVIRNLTVMNVTTSTVSLTWIEPVGNSSLYRVHWTDGRLSGTLNVTETYVHITNLTAGVKNEISVTAVAGDGHTGGQSFTFVRYTKPEVIRNLTVMNVTTSTVSLTWIEPVGNSSLYRVHWTDGRLSGTLNVTETYVHITNLTAGVKNEISVTAVADDGHTGGQSFTVVRYTKPEVIRNFTVMNVTTSTVSLTWIEPVGNSSLYRVHWTDGRLSGTLNVTETYVHITNLTAGVKNEISVTAVADDGHTGGQSFTVVRYTKPEVIRNLTVMNVTTSTVSLTWIEPVGNSSLYRVHWTDGRLSGTLNVTETYVHITNLTAGVKNEISVTAVADDGHTGGQSFTVVRFTKPEVIRNLTVMNVTTSTVSLTWIEPVGNSSLYRVHWTDGRLSGTLNVTETYVHITNLTAGVKNEISVTAVADDGHTGGQSFTVVRYTMPKAVTNLTVSDVNTTAIRLTWLRQSDYKPSYSYVVMALQNATEVQKNRTGTESYTFSDLRPGNLYTFYVFTYVEEVKSSGENTSNYTRPDSVTRLRQAGITTNAVTLVWEQPNSKTGQSYVVLVTQNSSSFPEVQVFNTTFTSTGLSSGSNTSFTVTTQTTDGTPAAPVTVYYFTRPYSITGLKVGTLNTTTGRLVWSEPQNYKSEYKYRVETTGCRSQNQTVPEEAAVISELTPGTNCTFCVFVIAADGTEGEENCTSQYTEPETVQVSLSSQGSNSSVLVSWTKPPGKVEHFKVHLNSTSSTFKEEVLNSTSNSSLFEGLHAGTLYSARVFTCSGPFNASSEYIHNATFPNPPGSVEVLTRTTSSLEVRWGEAPLMKAPSFFYKLTHTPSHGGGYNTSNTSNTSHTLDFLLSGTSYNISIATVGPMDFESEKVHIYMVTTRPHSITGLKVETLNTTTRRLVWSGPQNYKSEYKYRVQTTGCSSQNQTVQEKAAVISELTPGTNCTFCVFVIAADGTEGEENCTSQYTEPETVQVSLSSQGSNRSVLVTWTKPPGKVEHFKVHLNSTSSTLEEKELNSTSNSSLFEGLHAGTLYSARVFTCSGPFNASSEYIHNATFPNPPGSVEILRRTTSSIEVRWGEAPLMTAPSFFYKLTHTPSHGGGYNTSNTSNTSHTLDSLLSGTSYNISIATVGPMDFESEKVHIYMVTTRPHTITGLKVETLNTTTVGLVWSEPQNYKSEYKYRVQTTGCSSQNQTVQEKAAVISELTPGTNCTFCVFVIAANGTEGEENCTSQYTEPETVQVSLSSQGSNRSVLVTWTKPPGKVEHFKVHLNSTSSTFKEEVLNSTSNSSLFEGLSAGTLYSARVFTCSGPFNASSEYIHNATFPNPPGLVVVLRRTTSSIEVRWGEAPLMKAPSFFYKLTHTPSHGGGYNTSNTSNTSHTLDFLLSGTSYNISIATVGPMDFESEKVHIYMVTTRPHSITGLKVETLNTTTRRLVWSEPLKYKSEYKYRVQTTGCRSQNQTVQEKAAVISELTPGTNCTFCVFVIAADGTEGEENCTSQYTEPETVQVSLSSQGSNRSVLVTWTKPPGKVEHFKVHLNSTSSTFKEEELNSTSNSFLFEGLSAGTLYSARVFTCSGPFNASSEYIHNATFPNPPGLVVVLRRTTSSIEVRWGEAPLMTAPSFFYKLTHTPSHGGGYNTSNTSNTSHTLDFLLSGTSYNISIATVGPMDFESEKVHIYMVTTRPHSITGLKVETLNTTTVGLVWSEPQNYKSEYKYRVQTTGCSCQNQTVQEKAAVISELTPGTNCTFCVFVIAADGTEGEENCTSQYTEPETVQVSLSSQGSNRSVLVSWTKPPGKVEHFKVHLNSTSSTLEEKELNSTSNSFLFESLSAGTLYSARVFTCSGPFNASSEYIHNATFPNPPGSVEVLRRTTSSIEVRWGEAPLMTAPSFFYKLTHTPSHGGGYNTSNTTSHTFDSLLPGTSYNISITTVGVMGFESKKIHIYMVTTTELRVESVVACMTQEDHITVAWDPVKYTGSFYYRFKWTNRHGLQNITTQNTTYTIYDLDPGSRHNFSVTPEISDGNPGITTMNSSCTNASRVNNLKCEGPNEPEAKIILSWNKPRGQHSGLRVTTNDSNFVILTNTSYNYTVLYLHHNTKCRQTVETLSCGLPSPPVSCESLTGITDPPIPPNYEELLELTGKTHNQFSLQINRELLDNTKGPVTHVGVLVTNHPADVDTSNLNKYMGNTYDQWRDGDTPMYLATVKETNPQSRSGGNTLDIEVGDQTKWNGYTNGALEATGQYQYAIVLFTNVTLTQGELVNPEESLASVTKLFTVVILPQNPAVIGVAVGATLGIFCVLFIILIGFIIYWKRFNRKEPSDIQIQSMRAKVSVAVRIEDYERYYKKQRADSNCGFAEEFEDLKAVGTGQSRTSALTIENKSKNRYNNVLPYDFSRVKLSIIHGSPFDDYINANYMPGYNSRKEFIAAQGPLPITISDFWRMIWEKNVLTLVMLTRCNEQGRVKCEQYWGFDTKNCDNITVTTTSDIPLDDWTIRDFDIKNVKTAETRSVRQFHFTAWPDHGVPETTELLIDFRHLVREHMDQYSRHSPTVVHCSAGVGRTGTFIAIDRLIFQIERDDSVDVYGIVHDQRMHRTLMVQTEDQYVFLNQCAMDIIRSRTGTNVDLIYQNVAALSEYENIKPQKRLS